MHFGPVPGGFAISRIELTTEGSVPGVNAAAFEKTATEAEENCPVSKALSQIDWKIA
jgi:osmotically inducible protein OsmC